MKSLRARLLWSVSVATLVVWCIAVVVSYQSAHHEAVELLDGQLAQSTRLLLAQVRHEMKNLHEWDDSMEHEGEAEKFESQAEPLVELLESDSLHDYEQPLEFQVWAMDKAKAGRLLLRSQHAPAMLPSAAPGYADMAHDGQAWRTLTRRDKSGEFQVQVAHPTGNRDRAALEVAMRVSVPFAVALPLLVLLLFLAVGRSLRPLDRLAQDVGRRAPDALIPLPMADMPRETLPLLSSLNTLLQRLDQALDKERRFTADAAHELRTPLAAIRVQAQVAQKARDEATRSHALNQVLAGVGRATRLVEQLLRLARLDHVSGVLHEEPFPVRPLLQRVSESLCDQALAKGIAVEVEAPPELVMRADSDLLSLALRNLLENALRYLPDGGRITLGAEVTHGAPRIWVRDDGAGVAEEELARLTERFYRGRDVSTEGSGLGLAIVQRVSRLHGGELTLANLPGRGFQATMAFPSATAPAANSPG